MAAFSMKVTITPGDCDKVNQVFPIMQAHLVPVKNLARIKLLAFVLHALCIVQTVSLHKIASAMPTGVERDSNLRRLQRFLAGYALSLDLIAIVIFALLPVKTGLVLSLDRTNWKFGDVNIDILMPGVAYKKVAFLLYNLRLLFCRFRLVVQSDMSVFSFTPRRNRLKNKPAYCIN